LIGTAWPFTLADTLREPASIAWAEEVAAAESQFQSYRTAQELVAKGHALIQLYRGCTACRENVYRQLTARLESAVEGRELVPVIEREEYADSLLQLGRALLRQGSPLEARAIALREIDKSAFLEERLEWVELLAHVHVQLGEVHQAERLIQRLRSETPVSPDYCAKEMKWRGWLTGSPETIEPIVDAATLDRALEEIHAHSQRNPTDPETCCRC
jgi:tetratricopeptide (TPR) repeat protein